MRELIASHGIKAEEIEWFRNEIRSSEKRALKAVEKSDELLADAYRETLASRLTATRIIRSSRQELQASKRRQQKIRQFKSENSKTFRQEIEKDIANISQIHNEAKEMLSEAESRLQMIEAAAARGSNMEGNRIALKKLEMRSSELPRALNDALRTEELRKSVERELLESGDAAFESDLLPSNSTEDENVGESEPRNRSEA
jgi:phage regulator Rha-like protein